MITTIITLLYFYTIPFSINVVDGGDNDEDSHDDQSGEFISHMLHEAPDSDSPPSSSSSSSDSSDPESEPDPNPDQDPDDNSDQDDIPG